MEFRIVNGDGSTGDAPDGLSDLLSKLFGSIQQQATRKRVEGGIRVGFEYRYDETIDWDADEDNVSPYIQLSNPDQSIARQRAPAEVVIPMPVIRIQFDYPLGEPVIYDYQADTPSGFSRIHLARCVVAGYNRIYKEEGDFVKKQKHEAKYGPCYVWRMIVKRNNLYEVFSPEVIELINRYCICHPEKRFRNGPIMLNRETTTGPHGIWGHSLGDLVLHTVEQIEDNLFSLGVDS